MTGDLLPTRPGDCQNPARLLLDFYLNGSLEGPEEEQVRAHLDGCAACSAEVDEMSQIVRASEQFHVDPISIGTSRAWSRRTVGIAASVVLAVAAFLAWRVLDAPGDSQVPARPPLVVSIDLGSGALRGGRIDVPIEIPRAATTVRFALYPPVVPGATYMAALARDEHALTEEMSLSPLDALGRAEVAFAAATLDTSGPYELQLRVATPDGASRTYRFPFAVRVTAAPR